jgi:CheY-like chemotaxis protein
MAVRADWTRPKGHDRLSVDEGKEALGVTQTNETELLGFVAHELRTPITVIVGLAATLAARRDRLTSEQVDESLEQILLQGERLAQLVEDLLDLAQVDAGRFLVALESVGLGGAGRRALDDAPVPPGHSVELALPDDLRVVADARRLDQVLVNLLTNAYRHGGRNVRVEASRTGEGVLTVVSDDGDGVPVEVVPRLFEAFSRGPPGGEGGTGLGLAIVQALVEAFGGRVWYEPAEPHGARFGVLLSEAEPGLLNEAEPGVDNRGAGSDEAGWNEDVLRILVVDDESNMRFLLRMMLESDGYEVLEARYGAEALALVTESEADPDLVVTDLMMPVMGGRELVERLRADAESAEIPIVVVTSGQNADVPGADAILGKPFDPDELLGVARSLSRRRERA